MPFKAYPQPSVTLTFNGGKVHNVDRIKHETVKNCTTFILDDAARLDAGNYMLSLTNQYGTASMTITVTVLGQYNLILVYLLHILTFHSKP